MRNLQQTHKFSGGGGRGNTRSDLQRICSSSEPSDSDRNDSRHRARNRRKWKYNYSARTGNQFGHGRRRIGHQTGRGLGGMAETRKSDFSDSAIYSPDEMVFKNLGTDSASLLYSFYFDHSHRWIGRRWRRRRRRRSWWQLTRDRKWQKLVSISARHSGF